MKYSIALLLAAWSVALAQINEIPSCAISCATQAAGMSSCDLLDFTCQCTTGRQAVQQALIPCLCQTECSSEEVLQAVEAGEDLCAAALSSAGQSYAAPTATPSNVCAALSSAMPSGSMSASSNSSMSSQMTASASETGTASLSGYSNSTATGTGTDSAAIETSGSTGSVVNNEASATGNSTETGVSETGTATASLASSTGGAPRMSLEGALVGLAGLAVLVL